VRPRAVKVGRRPPEGEALMARSVLFCTMEGEAREAFVVVPFARGGRVRSCPRASSCWRCNPSTRVPVICSPRETA
jgi:hypothetical protein